MIAKDLKVCRKCFDKLWPGRTPEVYRRSRPIKCEMCKRRVKLTTTIRHRAKRELINL